MAIYWVYLAAIGLSMGLASISTPAINYVGIRLGQMDMPMDLKVHNQPMVRLGGVAIFGSTMLAIACFWDSSLTELLPVDAATVRLLLLGACGFFAIGLTDDFLKLTALHRSLYGCSAAHQRRTT